MGSIRKESNRPAEITQTSQDQIIFPGFVYNNQDPMQLGRLRVMPIGKTYQDIINDIVDNYFDTIHLNVSVAQIKLKNILENKLKKD